MDDIKTNEGAVERAGVSRRVVVKSAAWSLPVFATVGITPAFAASGGPQTGTMTATRSGQSKTISFSWTLTIPANTTIKTVTIGTATGITFSAAAITGSVVTFTGTVPSGNKVPTFQATVILSTNASTTFSVTGANVPNSTTLDVRPA